jgi:membrane-bound inhibitor of C-type lysozyme
MRTCSCSIVGAFAICTLVACQHPAASSSIGVGNPYPVSTYVCDGTHLAVRLMGESASVSIDGAAAVTLPAIGESGTKFSNGRQTLVRSSPAAIGL